MRFAAQWLFGSLEPKQPSSVSGISIHILSRDGFPSSACPENPATLELWVLGNRNPPLRIEQL
jgi:hypothetical protein